MGWGPTWRVNSVFDITIKDQILLFLPCEGHGQLCQGLPPGEEGRSSTTGLPQTQQNHHPLPPGGVPLNVIGQDWAPSPPPARSRAWLRHS